MSRKFLDDTGLGTVWTKIKSAIAEAKPIVIDGSVNTLSQGATVTLDSSAPTGSEIIAAVNEKRPVYLRLTVINLAVPDRIFVMHFERKALAYQDYYAYYFRADKAARFTCSIDIDTEGNISTAGITLARDVYLPTASASTLGGVKVGSNLTITNGVLSADEQQYTLPTASASTLGGIKVGSNLSIDSDGVLSATGGSGSGELIVDATALSAVDEAMVALGSGAPTLEQTVTAINAKRNVYMRIVFTASSSDYKLMLLPFEYMGVIDDNDDCYCFGFRSGNTEFTVGIIYSEGTYTLSSLSVTTYNT